MSIVRGSQSFTPSIHLNGPVGDNINMQSVPRTTAYKYIKRTQLEYIKKDYPKFVIDEVNDMREILRDPSSEKWSVSMLIPTDTKENLFTILYRMTEGFPVCYTVEAIVRNHDVGTGYGSISIIEIERMLNQMVIERRGHLQLYPLRSWAGGRYRKELDIEKIFDSLTLDFEEDKRGHSGDFRNFGLPTE